MFNFSKYLSRTTITGLLAFGAATGLGAASAPDDPQLIDLNGVVQVRLSGANTRVNVTADPALPTSVTILDHGGDNCRTSAVAERKGDVMNITFEHQKTSGLRFGFFERCESDVLVNIAPGTDLDLALDKMVARIDGAYGALNIRTDDAVVDFKGQAAAVDMDGDKVVATMVMHNSEATDHVRVRASKLVIDMGFAAQARLAYRINAPVAVFSRGLEAASGGTKIEIVSDVLQGSTYVDSSAL